VSSTVLASRLYLHRRTLASVTGVTQDQLLERAQSGDPSAVDELLRLHYNAVHAVCHRMVLSREGADDAVQNALIAIVKGLPRFDRRAAVSTWVYRIATNAAIDEIRRVKRQPRTTEITDATQPRDAGAHGIDPMSELEENLDRSSLVASALARVPEEFRVALVLRFVADLDYGEIAEALNIPIGTVRSRLARGRKLLGEYLGVAGVSDVSSGLTPQTDSEEPNLESDTSNTSPS